MPGRRLLQQIGFLAKAHEVRHVVEHIFLQRVLPESKVKLGWIIGKRQLVDILFDDRRSSTGKSSSPDQQQTEAIEPSIRLDLLEYLKQFVFLSLGCVNPDDRMSESEVTPIPKGNRQGAMLFNEKQRRIIEFLRSRRFEHFLG